MIALRRAALVVLPALVAGCSDVSLYGVGTQPNLADRISFQGDVCTDDPSAVAFPVKILVVIDGTADLAMADPNGNRANVLQAVLARYSGTNYHFGFIQFAGQARLLTQGYADDLTRIQPALDAISIGGGEAQRNYYDALRAAASTVQDDLLAETPGVRSRTRYVVLFISAGPPTPALQTVYCQSRGIDPTSNACDMAFTTDYCSDIQPPPADCEAALYTRTVSDLRAFALDNGAQDFILDSFALTTDRRTNNLCTSMAVAGAGAFEQQPPDGLNLFRVDLAASSSLLLQRQLLVYNPATVVRDGQILADSDGDGLPDATETMLGTDPRLADTDGDHVGDGIEVMLAAPGLDFDPLVAKVPEVCKDIDPPDLDRDADELSDCEEAVLRTDPSLVDTDKDGLPDLVEVRRGGNPLADDLLVDSDQDGIPNGVEVAEGLGARDGDAQWELAFGYRYRVVDEGPRDQLEAVPHDPIAGVIVEHIDGSQALVGVLRYVPGPPALLSWSDDAQSMRFGKAVDVSAGGHFMLAAATPSGPTLSVSVVPQALPVDATDQKMLVRPTHRSCFHFDVRNVLLAETLEVVGGRPGAGWNPIHVYLAEVPQSAPRGYLIFNLATSPVRFVAPDHKTPNQPFITLSQDSFVLLEGAP